MYWYNEKLTTCDGIGKIAVAIHWFFRFLSHLLHATTDYYLGISRRSDHCRASYHSLNQSNSQGGEEVNYDITVLTFSFLPQS